jgi:hypothetical protein
MSIAQTNFDIDQGSDFRLDVELKDSENAPIDVTNALIIGQIRKTASSKEVQTSFLIEEGNFALGKFALILSAATTSKLKCNPSYSAYKTTTLFAYDVEIHYASGKIDRILTGVLNISPEVTR